MFLVPAEMGDMRDLSDELNWSLGHGNARAILRFIVPLLENVEDSS